MLGVYIFTHPLIYFKWLFKLVSHWSGYTSFISDDETHIITYFPFYKLHKQIFVYILRCTGTLRWFSSLTSLTHIQCTQPTNICMVIIFNAGRITFIEHKWSRIKRLSNNFQNTNQVTTSSHVMITKIKQTNAHRYSIDLKSEK